jgi:hypothetical protein
MTFQYGQITAASPLALSASFRAPFLNRSAPSAVVTVRQALEQLPADVQSDTLEQVALREKARAVIALAEQRLSKPMYDAFLLWGERAAMLGGQHPSDASLTAACDAQDEAARALYAVAATTREDIYLRSYLVLLEQVDAGGLTPVLEDPDPQWTADFLTASLINGSELLTALDELSRLHRPTVQPNAKWEFEDAEAVASEFAKARAKHIRGQSALELLIDELRHLDQLTRELDPKDDDPINQLHLDAEDDFLAFRPTNVTHILRKIDVMSSRGCNLGDYVEEFLVRDLQALAVDAAADEARMRTWNEALSTYARKLREFEECSGTDKDLLDALGKVFENASDSLISGTPAPNLAALAIKIVLGIQRACHCQENLFSDHAAAIAADARRLGEALGIDFSELLQRPIQSAALEQKQAA